VLLFASAVSEPTTQLLAAAVGRESTVRAGLAAAVAADVAAVEAGRIRFMHPLLASVVYQGAPVQTRRQLHRKLAEIVPNPEEAARHLALATTVPDALVASRLDEAARRAGTSAAPDAAAWLCEQAERLTPAGSENDARRRLRDAAAYHLEAGDSARAQHLLEAVVASSPSGDVRAEALNGLAQTFWFADYQRAARLFRDALDEKVDEPAVRAASEFGLALSMLLCREDLSSAAHHAHAAVAMAERARDDVVRAQALTTQSLLHCLLARPDADWLMQRALALEPAALSLRVLRHPRYLAAILWTWLDRFDAARSALVTVWHRAHERGDENALPWIALHLSTLERLVGNWEEAERWSAEGLEAAVQSGQESVRAVLLSGRALLEAHRGRSHSVRRLTDEALDIVGRAGSGLARTTSLWALGLLELSAGRPAEAHAHLRPVVDAELATGIVEPGALRFLPDTIEALISLGQLSEAETLVDLLDLRARALDRASARAASARCRGLILAARGDLPGALLALEDGVEQQRRLAQPFELGRTLLTLGVIQRRVKRRRAGRETLEVALALFEELGAVLWAERARAELARIGGRPASRGEPTPSEWRVAELVAQGKTNREAAAELFVTVHMVEKALTRVYQKLGVRSRSQLARRLAELRILADKE
jgi:DNA-binding CsgD family transcriptional regulator